jgi:UDP-N-acetylglucosamine 2-epimerase
MIHAAARVAAAARPRMKQRIALIFGTRPEAIKLCPLALALRDHDRLAPHVCVTGQHRQMLDQVLSVFGVTPDVDLALMQPNQTLAGLTSRAIAAIDGYLHEHAPAMVIVQGDTTTAFCAALAAFYRKVPVGHVEAGLRTWDRHSPFPEEINRVLTSQLTDLHFPPTEWAADNLRREGVAAERVLVTGNTVIDALGIATARADALRPEVGGVSWVDEAERGARRVVLITGHRRENFGAGFEAICGAVATLARRFADVEFVYPVHLNPNVREPVNRVLRGLSNVHLIEPLSYLAFVRLMKASTLILTDSGGVQEEAPSLGKPVLVMRDTTERPEAVSAGTVRLVGADAAQIVDGVSLLLRDRSAYDAMARAHNPYGDGAACGRIVAALERYLGATPAEAAAR